MSTAATMRWPRCSSRRRISEARTIRFSRSISVPKLFCASLGGVAFGFQQRDGFGRLAGKFILALLERGDGALLQILDAGDQLLELQDFLLVLGDGDGDRPAGGGDGVGAIADLLAQDHQRVAIDDRLGRFVAVGRARAQKTVSTFPFLLYERCSRMQRNTS